MDLVEATPQYDGPGRLTALHGARLILEAADWWTGVAGEFQLGAQLFLQRANGRRQAGLDDIQAARSAGEMLLLCYRNEMLHLFQIHPDPRCCGLICIQKQIDRDVSF